ncbi:MAG TPA: hypothetical protein VHO95_10770, partial [Candidatus Dormibacteraeota bacterium]|nr:hypothetical protein [Candidatus Dormibacteraeota bacterium]
LVYYHPAASNAAAQEGLVVRAVAACREAELPLFVEPLTYSIGPALEGPERRRVIVETARRMSELGADVLKLQFPYGREETDAGKWREACAEITSSVQRPWVLLSGDNPPDAFVGLADAACAAGASGIACGRGIWTEAPQLTGSAREAFFNSVARARLERLVEVVETRARPWTDAYPRAELDGEDWYKTRS